MRILNPLTLSAIAAIAILAGCSGGQHETPAPPAAPAAEAAPQKAAAALPASFEVGQEVRLAGAWGCGHCSFHVGDGCAAAIQTADGRIFILDVDESHELYAERFSGKSVELQGVIASAGETPHVTVETYTIGS